MHLDVSGLLDDALFAYLKHLTVAPTEQQYVKSGH
jgi:hypothetical protein